MTKDTAYVADAKWQAARDNAQRMMAEWERLDWSTPVDGPAVVVVTRWSRKNGKGGER